jgi:hypothetical protein
VYEASEGYGVSLDTQTQEERQQVEDALQKVEEHNRRVRGRR